MSAAQQGLSVLSGQNEPAIDDEGDIQRPRDAFNLILQRAMNLGLERVAKTGGVKFTIGTMCSGTDAPVLALRELKEAAMALGLDRIFDFDHTFSVEIEPFKQAFIERNAKPSGSVFRDVVEFSDRRKPEATTAAGAKKPIPEAPDILVAGSSCVDFSRQNAKRNQMLRNSCLHQNWQQYKDHGDLEPMQASRKEEVLGVLDQMRDVFDSQGESTRTFVSILSYVFERRPKIILLENVAGAPWDQMAKFWLPLVGYRADYCKSDSKDFLVPQTRTRGYLIAADHWVYKETSTNITESWSKLMDQRRWFKDAFPEVHKFLLHPFDSRILEARFFEDRRIAEHLSRENEGRMWAFEHQKIRREEGLGDAHPYTGMDGRGNLTPKDVSWQDLVRGLGGRSQDLLDITFIRAAKGGVDLQHKARSLDVGQGVDRMAGKFGLVGCILPDGDVFLCDQGRPILGVEALALQGIPIDRISSSIETQAELHHMAGNAMTTTVVGAALLCAIMAERAAIGTEQGVHGLAQMTTSSGADSFSLRPSEKSVMPTILPTAFEPCEEFSSTEFIQGGMDLLMAIYKSGRRYCPCGGYRKHYPGVGLEQCSICEEVRCKNCKGNPSHHFQAIDVPSVVPVDETVRSLKHHLPGRFQFSSAQIGSVQEDSPKSLVLEASYRLLGSVFYFDKVTLGNAISVTYKSCNGRIKLVLEEKGIIWLAFLSKESAAHPGARAFVPQGRFSILPDASDWEVFYQSSEKISLSFDFSADGFHCALSDPEQITGNALQGLATRITGSYERSEECGTPLGTMYVKMEEEGRIFVLLQSGPTSSANDDNWAFTAQAHKWDPEEYREILCEFPRKWKTTEAALRVLGGSAKVNCSIPGFWLRAFSDDEDGFRFFPFPPQLRQPGQRSSEDVRFATGLSDCFPDPQMRPVTVMELQLPVPDMDFAVRLLPRLWDTRGDFFQQQSASTQSEGQPWLRVDAHHQKDAFEVVAFALDKLRQEYLPQDLRDGFATSSVGTFRSLDHGVLPPPVHRKWLGGKVVETFEDPREVEAYSQNLSKRPLPIELDVRLETHQDTHGFPPELFFRLSLNATSLTHQAWLRLPKQGLEMGIRRSISTATRVGCRIDVQFLDPTLKTLLPFSVSVCRDTPEEDESSEEFQPLSFVENGVSLRQDQQRSIHWMIRREGEQTRFVEKETEEYLVPETSIRFEAFAETTNRARGGVLAHDVGFGKTVMTLGLIDVQRRRLPGGSLEERTNWTGRRHQHLKATLIICPPQIVQQWQSEAQRFLGHGWVIVIINRSQDVSKDKLEKADIVIMSSAFLMEASYLSSLSEISGAQKIAGCDSLYERDFRDWYRKILDIIGDLRELPSQDAGSLLEAIMKNKHGRETAMKEAEDRLVPPSSRKHKVKKEKAKGLRAELGKAVSEKALQQFLQKTFQGGLMLQFYSWDRVVLDEFSYENKSISAFFSNTVAGSKWILSGTPPMANLGQVCAIGELVNMHIARHEPSVPPYFPSITRWSEHGELTASEKLKSYGPKKSAQFSVDRHRQAETFLVDKVRRRETDTAHIKVTEQVVVCYMDAASSAVYAQLQQALYNAKWDLDEVDEDTRSIMNVLLQKTGTNTAAKARQNLRISIRNSIDVLLAQASSNLSPFVRQLRRKFGFKNNDNPVQPSQNLLSELISVHDSELARHKALLKSQLDMVMYVAALVENDEQEMDHKINKVQKEKRQIYRSHLADFVGQMTSASPDKLGGAEIRDDLFSALAPGA